LVWNECVSREDRFAELPLKRARQKLQCLLSNNFEVLRW
jgi:hypothetical protein